MRDNLILRGNTYHVRLAIPADVRPYFGNRKLLSQSLKTGLQQEAKDKARAILLQWKNEIEQARQTRVENADKWRDELADHALGLHGYMDQSLLAAAKKVKHDVTKEEVFALMAKQRMVLQAVDLDDSLGLVDRLDEVQRNFFSRKISRIEHVTQTNEIFRESFLHAAKQKMNLLEPDFAEAAQIIAEPTSYKPKSPITKAMLDTWASHLVTQIKTEKTRDRLKQCVQRFSDYLTKEGAPLSFDTVHSFLGTLPPARQTRSNYLWAGRTFWKWANKYNQTFREQFKQQPCPFDGHELPRVGDAAGRERDAYTREEIESLHKQAVESGRIPLANLIQVAAYTGARLEEIGRIRPEDTIYDDNSQPIGFKVLDSKTNAGIRDIPLHPALVPLFKELSSKASSNDGYLFPGGNNKYGNRMDALGKQFGRLKKKSFSGDHTFHSIRHSVITFYHQLGVSLEIYTYIVGHKPEFFTLTQYSKGPSFEQKAQAVGLLFYDF